MVNTPPLPIFDALCRVCERHYPGLLPVLKRARLFKFPGRPHEILPTEFTDDEIELIADYFFLPFDYVAVEDPASCLILWDAEPGQSGWYRKRFFVECLPMYGDPKDFMDGRAELGDIMKSFRDMGVQGKPYVVTMGWIQGAGVFSNKSFAAEGNVDVVFTATEKELVMRPEMLTNGQDALKQPTMRNAIVALQEVAYFNSPNRFILERKQRKRSKVKPGKIARSFNRSMFTMMTPGEIRAQLNLGNGDGPKKAPHARRRHYRTYRDERYTTMRGRTVLIPASWIGPHKATMEGYEYEVRLDL